MATAQPSFAWMADNTYAPTTTDGTYPPTFFNETVFEDVKDTSAQDRIIKIISQFLLFTLVFGLAGTVEFAVFKSKFSRRGLKGILTGVFCQFIMLPLLAFFTVWGFSLEPVYATMILIVCSSPGGAYSNWYCSLFNVDLALSVAMTTISNVLALGLLPFNIFLYVTVLYSAVAGEDATDTQLDWADILITLALVLAAIALGTTANLKKPEWSTIYNRVGNLAGLALIVTGFFASAKSDIPWYQYEFSVILACMIPPISAIIFSLVFSTYVTKLDKPERVAVAIEASYQNTGMALAIALNFTEEKNGFSPGIAAGVPTVYAFVVIPMFIVLGTISWLCDWTYAPKGTNFFKMLGGNFQPSLTDSDDDKHASAAVEAYNVATVVEDKKNSISGGEGQFEEVEGDEEEGGARPSI